MTAPWPRPPLYPPPRPGSDAPPPERPRRRWLVHVAWAVGCLVSLFVGVGLVVNSEERPYGSQREAWSAGRTAGESEGYSSGFAAARRVYPSQPATSSTPSPAAPSQAQAFTAGTRTVGDGPGEVPPGTYRTGGPTLGSSASCYWARLSGTGGTLDDIIANERVTSGASIVTVRSSDEAIQWRGPCTWLIDDEDE